MALDDYGNWFSGISPAAVSLPSGPSGTITTSQVWSAEGPPTHTPTVANQVYTDTLTGAQYYWYNSTWDH